MIDLCVVDSPAPPAQIRPPRASRRPPGGRRAWKQRTLTPSPSGRSRPMTTADSGAVTRTFSWEETPRARLASMKVEYEKHPHLRVAFSAQMLRPQLPGMSLPVVPIKRRHVALEVLLQLAERAQRLIECPRKTRATRQRCDRRNVEPRGSRCPTETGKRAGQL